jgi:hypothetical protein
MGTNTVTQGKAGVGNIGFKGDPGASVSRIQQGTIARADTVAKKLFTLPPRAVLDFVKVDGAAVSNAGTTATIGIGTSVAANQILTGFDVKAATGAGQQMPAGVAGGLAALPNGSAIYGIYAETGGASSSGGPWTVSIGYHVP